MTHFSESSILAATELSRRASSLSRQRPGSREELICQHALDLCVFRRATSRAPVQFLVHDCLRDARRSLGRSADRAHNSRVRYAAVIGVPDDYEHVEEEVMSRNSELVAAALKHSATLAATGPVFVRQLLNGASISEAAQAAGVSRAEGYRWKNRLAEALSPYRELHP